MSITVLKTAPAFEPVRQIDGRIVPPSSETAIRWGDKYFAEPPAIGTTARVTFNRLGAVLVTGYFVEENFLGVVATLLDADPIKRNRGQTTVYLFGAEIAPA
jgi:hypothetical protein